MFIAAVQKGPGRWGMRSHAPCKKTPDEEPWRPDLDYKGLRTEWASEGGQDPGNHFIAALGG